jgi:hypothetical protein
VEAELSSAASHPSSFHSYRCEDPKSRTQGTLGIADCFAELLVSEAREMITGSIKKAPVCTSYCPCICILVSLTWIRRRRSLCEPEQHIDRTAIRSVAGVRRRWGSCGPIWTSTHTCSCQVHLRCEPAYAEANLRNKNLVCVCGYREHVKNSTQYGHDLPDCYGV